MLPKGQKIENGNGNIQAQGDVAVVNNYFRDYQPSIIRFYEGDICKVLEKFKEYIAGIEEPEESISLSELELIEKPEKNCLNNLSEDYFETICEEYLTYFWKIDLFLKAPQNKEYMKLYRKTAMQLNFRIGVLRKRFEYFEEVLHEILNNIISNDESSVVKNIDVFIVFINYMYWNCDIGKRK